MLIDDSDGDSDSDNNNNYSVNFWWRCDSVDDDDDDDGACDAYERWSGKLSVCNLNWYLD